MNRIYVIALLLLIPQLAAARVDMCVDEDTGATSFTDKACETVSTREEVRVDPVNLNSGARKASRSKRKTWRSQADSRKDGTDFNDRRRALYKNKATAGTN
jgi:hypothetical protein